MKVTNCYNLGKIAGEENGEPDEILGLNTQANIGRTMNLAGWIETIFFLISLLIMAGAIFIFLYRIIRRKPFWPSFKKMARLFFDGFWGMG